jgi:hypothetical protein
MPPLSPLMLEGNTMLSIGRRNATVPSRAWTERGDYAARAPLRQGHGPVSRLGHVAPRGLWPKPSQHCSSIFFQFFIFI